MMTSSNGNILRVTGHLCGNSPVPGEFPTQRPVTRSFDVFFDLRRINSRVNNREASDLRRHRAHFDVIIMLTGEPCGDYCEHFGNNWPCCNGIALYNMTCIQQDRNESRTCIRLVPPKSRQISRLGGLYGSCGNFERNDCQMFWVYAIHQINSDYSRFLTNGH